MASVSLTRINVSDDDKHLIWGWLRRVVDGSCCNISADQMFPSAIVLLFILLFKQIDVWLPFHTAGVLFSRDHTTLSIIKSLRISNSPAIFYGKHIINLYKKQYSQIAWTLKFLKLSPSNEFKIGLVNVDDDDYFFCMTRSGLCLYGGDVIPADSVKYWNQSIDSKRFMKNDILIIRVYPDYSKNTVDISFFKTGQKYPLLMEYVNLPLKTNCKFKLLLHMSKIGQCKIQEFQLHQKKTKGN